MRGQRGLVLFLEVGGGGRWGYFIKLSLQNFHSWRERWGQREAPEMQRSGTASHTRNGSGGSWRSLVGSVKMLQW